MRPEEEKKKGQSCREELPPPPTSHCLPGGRKQEERRKCEGTAPPSVVLALRSQETQSQFNCKSEHPIPAGLGETENVPG